MIFIQDVCKGWSANNLCVTLNRFCMLGTPQPPPPPPPTPYSQHTLSTWTEYQAKLNEKYMPVL